MARPRKDKIEPDYSILQSQPGEHIPTIHKRARVIDFTCAGFTEDQIARYLNIARGTLRKHYANELDNAAGMRVGKLTRNLFRDALAGCKDSRKFYLQCRGGYAPCKPPEPEKPSHMEALLEKLLDKL